MRLTLWQRWRCCFLSRCAEHVQTHRRRSADTWCSQRKTAWLSLKTRHTQAIMPVTLCNNNSQRSHTFNQDHIVFKNAVLWNAEMHTFFTYLLSVLLCFRSTVTNGAWSLNRPLFYCWRFAVFKPSRSTLWLPKFNQFSRVHRYICGKIFMKIRSVVFT